MPGRVLRTACSGRFFLHEKSSDIPRWKKQAATDIVVLLKVLSIRAQSVDRPQLNGFIHFKDVSFDYLGGPLNGRGYFRLIVRKNQQQDCKESQYQRKKYVLKGRLFSTRKVK
ncbi:hypothetical protein DFP94_103198 [Fontibacillus phaseoli]|uniref:Uncharacterized protein n=1 Tax=Fontibacillus phaseoli TaxID=1416533 RepID=A0A369BIQ9_9BACL|nr:hypothetical protein DFP94_103198 [Fontibacillus phaseoli]